MGYIVDDIPDDEEKSLLCRRCGQDITFTHNIITIVSQLADKHRNETIHGTTKALVQLFTNPQGHQFEVITTLEANYTAYGEAHLEYSWFPGFKWRVIVCPVCGIHIGWSFETADIQHTGNVPQKFIGLILSKLLHQTVVDSLILTPSSYRTA
jgi:predicted nucleic-acid-binding Zn-ribbon protein